MSAQRKALGVNSTLNAMGLVVPGVVGLLATPLLVRGLGPADFAVFSIALMGLAYAPMSDLGMGRAVTVLVARGGDAEKGFSEGSVLWTALLAAVVVGSAMALSALALIRGTGLVAALLPDERASEAAWALSAVAFCLPLVTCTPVVRGALEGLQRFAFLNTARSVGNALAIGVPAAMATVGLGLEKAVVAMLVLRCTLTLLYAVGLLLGRPSMRRPSLAWPVVPVLLRSGSGMAATAALSPLLVLADRIAVGWATDAATMGWYLALSDMALWLRLPASSVAVAVFPMIADEWARDRGTAVSMMVFARRVVSFALFGLGTAAAAALPLLTVLIVGAVSFPGQWPVMGLLVLGSVALFHGYVPIAALEGSGKPWVAARVQLLELVPFIAAYFLAARHLGVVGVASVWAFRAALETTVLDRLALPRGAVEPPVRRRHALALRVHVAAFLAWACLALSLPVLSLGLGVVTAGLAGAASLAISAFMGLDRGERVALGVWIRERRGSEAR